MPDEIDNPSKTPAAILQDQHRQLETALAALKKGVAERAEMNSVVGLVGQIEELMRFHFLTEEDLLALHHYPGLRKHKTDHDRELGKITRLHAQLRGGRSEVANDLVAFLENWFARHVNGPDAGYMEFLRARGVR